MPKDLAGKTLDELIRQPKFKAGAELKARVVEAASKLFAEEGYQNVSIRRIAKAAGCSQMAMYRHFPDKASLITHLCVEHYSNQTIRAKEKLSHLQSPEERLVEAARQTIELAYKNPNHYRLAFVTPLPDANSAKIRAEIAKPAIEFFRKDFLQLLPSALTPVEVDEKLWQSFACLHGLILMLITYPKVYGITKNAAVQAFAKSLKQIVRG